MNERPSVEDIHGRVDPLIRDIWCLLVSTLGADEGSLWIQNREGDALRVALNSGGEASRIELSTQTSKVDAQVMKCFETGKPVEDVSTFTKVPRDSNIDWQLHQHTFYQISVPFVWQGERIGAVSVVQLNRERADRAWGFPPGTTDKLQIISRLLERLFQPSPATGDTTPTV